MRRRAPKLSLVWVGRTAAPYAIAAEREYLSRIGRYVEHEILIAPGESDTGRYSREHRLEREAEAIGSRLDKAGGGHVVAIDPRGKELDTGAFAKLMRREVVESAGGIVFVTGGPDGLHCSVRDSADRVIALSRLTFPHDMARVVLLEQIYRAFTIIHGHPYSR